MKHLLILFLPLIAASTCHATSSITFSGGGYEISVLLSDEDCKVVGLNVSSDNPNIISIGANQLTAFSKAESDCKKKTIYLVVPATKSHPHFELKSASKRGYMTFGEKKVNVSPDWQIQAAVTELRRAAEPDLELELTMPWILRFAIGSLFVFVIGAVMIAWACMSTGWETLGRFALGCVTGGAGLIGSALLAMLSAVIHQGWRRFSLALMSASVLLFVALLIFAKFA